jgi:hypothetical protein
MLGARGSAAGYVSGRLSVEDARGRTLKEKGSVKKATR